MFDEQGFFKKTKQNLKVNLNDIFQKQKSFETFNSNERGEQGSHSVPIPHLSKEAQRRLKSLNLEDFDGLWSFRMTGKQRLWCVKLNESLMGVLWWDPEHQVCPSRKRNT